jgi:hypothetical protein
MRPQSLAVSVVQCEHVSVLGSVLYRACAAQVLIGGSVLGLVLLS